MGSCEIGKKVTKTVGLQNTGIGNLIISKIYPEENLDNVYRVISPNLPFTLGSGMQDSISVEFTPLKAASYKTRLVIESNSIKDKLKYITLNGTGTGTSIFASDFINNVITIFPNPADKKINLSYEEKFNFDFYEIYNLNGYLIVSGLLINKEIPIGNLIKGTYFLVLKSDKIMISTKFLKE
jgi:hypothetical protein